jgi:hypothetical protein
VAIATAVRASPDVTRIYLDCEQKGQDKEHLKEIESLNTKSDTYLMRFNVDKLNHYQAQIEEMIDNLPDDFRKSEGAPLYRAWYSRDEEKWTEYPSEVYRLLTLGIAIGKIQIVSREPTCFRIN